MMLAESSALIHQYPIIEMTVAAIMALIAIMAAARADKGRRELPPTAQLPQPVQMYVDGPIKIICDHLENISNTLTRMEEQTRVELQVSKQVDEGQRASERNRWNDAFALVREVLDALRRLGERRPRS